MSGRIEQTGETFTVTVDELMFKHVDSGMRIETMAIANHNNDTQYTAFYSRPQ